MEKTAGKMHQPGLIALERTKRNDSLVLFATTCLMSPVLPIRASALPAPNILVFAKSALIIKTERNASNAETNVLNAMQLFVRNARATHCFSLVKM